MYIVVIAVFSIVLTLSRPLYPLVRDANAILAAVTAVTLLPAVVGVLTARRVLQTLDRYPHEPGHGQAVYGRGMRVIQVLLAVGHGAILLCTDWMPLFAALPVVGEWPVVPGLCALVPFLLSIVLAWIGVYPADRAVRQIALEVYLFRGRPIHPVWNIGRYLAYNLRHQVLFILVPMLLIMAAADLVIRYERPLREATGLPFAPDLAIGFAAGLVALIAPEILRHVWVTQRLSDGPLRDRLETLCRRLRMRCRDILVWRSGGMIVNAAVMGVVAPLRYVLITDAMLEQLDDAKIEAVFGHEAGHVKHHHIPYFLMFALSSGCLVTVFSVYTRSLAQTNYPLYQALLAGLGLLIAAKWGLLFGWVSRRFERQADIHGVRTLTLTGVPCTQPCLLHSPDAAENSAKGDQRPLCATAAQIFAAALHDVALLNGIQPEARSWRHSSIASRSRFLQLLAGNPQRHAAFERTVRWTQRGIFVATAGLCIWAADAVGIWRVVGGWVR